MPKLAYILSLPRSGSTVLSAMLDRKHGIISPPESSFPQVLGEMTSEERADPRRMAALYLGATFPPTPLSLEDAQACMMGTDADILVALGLACAVKLARDPSEVRAVIWKTPRTVGMHAAPLATGGKFIVLRRNPHNVFESQFRVGFGEKNRNPFRFAIFRESYEHAFARLPAGRVLETEYDDLPGSITTILDFLGLPDQGDWQNHQSSLAMAAEACSWMSEVNDEFVNRDPEKRKKLDPKQVARLNLALKIARPLRPLLGPLRRHFDVASLGPIRERAAAARIP
jgi:hypothetical protein